MLKGISAGLAAGALWGLVFVVPRMTQGLSSVDLTAGRFVSYGAMAALVMGLTWRAHSWPTAQQALAALGMSVLGATAYYLLLALAIHHAGTEVPTLIIGTIPIWVMLLGKPLVLMMKATLGAPVMGGVVGVNFWWGVALATAAMLCWTAFAILNAAWLKRHPEVSATEWTNWLGIATGLGALLLWVFAGSSTKELLALGSLKSEVQHTFKFPIRCAHEIRIKLQPAGLPRPPNHSHQSGAGAKHSCDRPRTKPKCVDHQP